MVMATCARAPHPLNTFQASSASLTSSASLKPSRRRSRNSPGSVWRPEGHLLPDQVLLKSSFSGFRSKPYLF